MHNAIQRTPTIVATDYTVKVTESSPEGYAKAYTISQVSTGLNVTINIPRDMVVESGNVVTDPAGLSEGTYLRLVLANATEDEIFIPVDSLVTQMTSGSQAGDIVALTIDSANNTIRATVVDGTITKAKLAPAVQTSLGKADTALQPTTAPGYNDILTKTVATATYVPKNGTDRLMTANEATKLAGISAGATKVAGSTNGNILINDVVTPVYTHPTTHTISEVAGLSEALGNKLEDSDIAGLAPKSTTLVGYGITDAYTKEETYSKPEVDALIAAMQAKIDALANPTE